MKNTRIKILLVVAYTMFLWVVYDCWDIPMSTDDVTILEEYNYPDVFRPYQKMSDGTWRYEDYIYKYRLKITGRMNSAVKDSTFVYLSNIETITFEQAWKAAGFSSHMDDYFDPEIAVLVELK